MPTKKTVILCCGDHGRAIVIGDVTRLPTPGKPVRLTNARMVLYWSKECGGLLGLAANGPKADTRITPAVPSVCETVWQEYVEVSPDAAEEIAKWPAC